MDAKTPCKHNWQKTHHGSMYLECIICHDRWNTERLVNALQSKVEQQTEQIEQLKNCRNCINQSTAYRDYDSESETCDMCDKNSKWDGGNNE